MSGLGPAPGREAGGGAGTAAAPGRLRQLFGHSALYAGSNLLQRGVGFLLVPLYARYFSRAEFGAMDQIVQGTLILILLTSLGLPQGLVRGLHLETRDEEERRRMIGALIVFLVPVALVVSAGLLLARAPLARMVFHGEGEPAWIALGAALYLAMSLYQLPLELLKIRLQARRYVAWSIATFLAIVAGNLYLIVGRGLGLAGMLIANAAAYALIGSILWSRTIGSIRLNAEFARLAPLLAYGLPMLPSLLCRKVLDVADRYMIPWYHGLDVLGIYVMGAKVAAIVEALLLVPFLYAWQPFFYSLSDDDEAPRTFARVTQAVALLLGLLFLSIQAAREPILELLGRGKFAGAGGVVTLLMLAVVCNGLQYCVSAGIHLRRKLTQEMGIMAAAAGVNLVLNLILIPTLAGTGAALATLAAYAFYLAGSFVLAQRCYPVPYAWGRLANVAAQTGLAFAVLTQVEAPALRAAVVAVWIVTCPLLDLSRHGDLRALRSWRRAAGPGEG
ncbi:MAG TPA: oligosaccharide flippase family protein [Patescibacteria group bacterium]|nr:oligosaccharide flippase family protein [Patescibacteria group bacterium]